MAAPDGPFAVPDTVRSTTPSWDFPRGASGTHLVTELATEAGLPANACLAGTGLTLADLEDPECVVQAGQELAAIRALVRATRDAPGWGARAGSRITLGMLGVWGYTMLLSPTVRDVIDTAFRLGPGRLAWTFLRPSLHGASGGPVRMRYDDEEVPEDLRGFLTERDLACTVTIVAAIAPGPLRLRVETGLDAARRAGLAVAVPGADVVAAAHHAVVLDPDLLRRRLPYGDPAATAAQEHACEQVAERRARHSGVVAQVRSALLRGPGWPSLEDVAAERHVDPRTLRRRLTAEGTTFRDLSDEVRSGLAQELLARTDTSIVEIARRLGYADPATFTRAFRRWTDTTPAAYRHRAHP